MSRRAEALSLLLPALLCCVGALAGLGDAPAQEAPLAYPPCASERCTGGTLGRHHAHAGDEILLLECDCPDGTGCRTCGEAPTGDEGLVLLASEDRLTVDTRPVTGVLLFLLAALIGAAAGYCLGRLHGLDAEERRRGRAVRTEHGWWWNGPPTSATPPRAARPAVLIPAPPPMPPRSVLASYSAEAARTARATQTGASSAPTGAPGA